jgi:Protein of unknown function (DUF1559)
MTVPRSVAYVGVFALACVPLTWLSRAITDAREGARSAQCVGNLKQIGLGLLNYESKYGFFRPAYVADATGKPLYCWRVLLMAEIDRTSGWFGGRLAGEFRFDEPWDSPNNRKLHNLVQNSVIRIPVAPLSKEPKEIMRSWNPKDAKDFNRPNGPVFTRSPRRFRKTWRIYKARRECCALRSLEVRLLRSQRRSRHQITPE